MFRKNFYTKKKNINKFEIYLGLKQGKQTINANFFYKNVKNHKLTKFLNLKNFLL